MRRVRSPLPDRIRQVFDPTREALEFKSSSCLKNTKGFCYTPYLSAAITQRLQLHKLSGLAFDPTYNLQFRVFLGPKPRYTCT